VSRFSLLQGKHKNNTERFYFSLSLSFTYTFILYADVKEPARRQYAPWRRLGFYAEFFWEANRLPKPRLQTVADLEMI
jgi:hypothetical protein